MTACAICGSDLHIYDGVIPEMESGDVSATRRWARSSRSAPRTRKLKVGDRVVVPFTISCGECFFCKRGYYSGCERSNPDQAKAEKLWGHSPAGLFGYSHLLGGYPGGQAEYLRVPFADVGPDQGARSASTDEQVLFLSDIFPTGYMAAEFCNIQAGDTIAIWGCGPVGQFAIRSAFLLGAERVIAIDTVPERLALAEDGRRETLDFMKEDIYERIQELTQRPRRRCLHRRGRHRAAYDGELRFGDRPGEGRDLHGHRPAACAAPGDSLLPQLRHGLDRRRLWRLSRQDSDGLGDQSRPHLPHGADAGAALPAEACWSASRRARSIRPSSSPHRASLEDGPELYKTFRDKKDGCIKVVLKP